MRTKDLIGVTGSGRKERRKQNRRTSGLWRGSRRWTERQTGLGRGAGLDSKSLVEAEFRVLPEHPRV